MKAHPIIDYPYRWLPALVLAVLLVATQTVLLRFYTEADWLPVTSGITTVGWFIALAYLTWFVVGIVSIPKSNLITITVGILLWLAGGFMVYDVITKFAGISYIPFAPTIPFRLLFGIPAWIAVTLWYHLQVVEDETSQEIEFTTEAEEASPQPQEEYIDRITVKDGSNSYHQDRRITIYPGVWRLCRW